VVENVNIGGDAGTGSLPWKECEGLVSWCRWTVSSVESGVRYVRCTCFLIREVAFFSPKNQGRRHGHSFNHSRTGHAW